jgi:hypothetical protein
MVLSFTIDPQQRPHTGVPKSGKMRDPHTLLRTGFAVILLRTFPAVRESCRLDESQLQASQVPS